MVVVLINSHLQMRIIVATILSKVSNCVVVVGIIAVDILIFVSCFVFVLGAVLDVVSDG